jgi:glycosyltransferase involved in cell wall biosynthesis
MSTQRLKVLYLFEEADYTRYWDGAFHELASRGIDLVFVTLRGRGPLHDLTTELGYRAFALDCRDSRDYPRAALHLSRIIKDEAIDVVHASESIQSTVAGLAGLRARRAKRIFHRHHTSISGSHRLYSRLGARLTHLTMAISESAARYAREEDGVPPERIRVAHNGVAGFRVVEDTEMSSVRQEAGIPDGARVIVTVGLLREEKGQRTLVQALPRVHELAGDDVHVLMVGDDPVELRDASIASGPERDLLKQLARPVSDRVHFLRHRFDVAPCFALADVVVVPSYREAFGLVAVEAMAAGKPLIASRVGGLEEIVVDGDTGLLVEPGDPGALAQAVSEVLGDPTKATALAQRGQQRFREHFTLEAMVQRWVDCYQELYRRG